MTPSEFKRKWSNYQGKETSAYQSHFNDLCEILGQKSPAAADPSGEEWFCFQKRVIKDLELFAFDVTGSESESGERGFADVWRKGYFAWEYKGKRKNLDAAYKQLLRYREALLNPPFLVVCDFDRFVVRTNFNGTVQETYEISTNELDEPENWKILRALFVNPESLRPSRTTAQITESLAGNFANISKSLQGRESIEYLDAKSRKELNFAQRKNLRIARFLNRIVFCFFAEDTELLPKGLVSEIINKGSSDSKLFAHALEDLFAVMATGGVFGHHKIRHFNGHLFEESTVFELTPEEMRGLSNASAADWDSIQPSIMGTLFERALDGDQRAQLGAHYTSETDIKALIEPVLLAPLAREWGGLKAEIAAELGDEKRLKKQRLKLAHFHRHIASVVVLDPACGSGNFLYVALQLLLDLEKEVINFAAQMDLPLDPQVGVNQLRAIEINPYAYELAQVSVQIGLLQWRRDNGFDNDRTPVLRVLDGFQNGDALLISHFHTKAKTIKEAQAGEHAQDDFLRFFSEQEWPDCDVVVGNPPFLGGKLLRRELGDLYVDSLFSIYGKRVEPQADLCCYWFEKARTLIAEKKCRRAGLLATQGIRGGANREVLKRIKDSGSIFFAISDRDWILAGADVHVSMIGFDDGTEKNRFLDGVAVKDIPTNLSSIADTTAAIALNANLHIAYMGDTKGGKFDITEAAALKLMLEPNPHGKPNSDVVVPWVNGKGLSQRGKPMFIVDFGTTLSEGECSKYEAPWEYLKQQVRPKRLKNNRPLYAKFWWRHVEPRPGMVASLTRLSRFLATVRHTKHRLFFWLEAPTKADSAMFAFASADDWFFGLLHSRIHEVWARQQATQVRERESGLRYTPSSCFETFPFPVSTPSGVAAIGAAAAELNALREQWLNPNDWVQTKLMEFPGSTNGPWARFIAPGTVNGNGVGSVRYPLMIPLKDEYIDRLKERTLTALYNLSPEWLTTAHQNVNDAVASAYGWPTHLTDKEILDRLLELNLQRGALERTASRTQKKKPQRGKSDDELI